MRPRFNKIFCERAIRERRTADGGNSNPPSVIYPKPICKQPYFAKECDWFQLGHLSEVTRQHQLTEDVFWNQSVNDIQKFFLTLPVEGGFLFHHHYAGGTKDDDASRPTSCSWVMEMQEACKLLDDNAVDGEAGLDLSQFKCRVELFGHWLSQ